MRRRVPPSCSRSQPRPAPRAFRDFWISDHPHPWNNAQGHSPFVWSMIGAISQVAPEMAVTTAVTCPTVRIHPAIIAQAAGFDELFIQQIGPDQEAFLDAYRTGGCRTSAERIGRGSVVSAPEGPRDAGGSGRRSAQ